MPDCSPSTFPCFSHPAFAFHHHRLYRCHILDNTHFSTLMTSDGAPPSTQFIARELYGTARCNPCQRLDARCHVAENDARCVKCDKTDDCIFTRSVQRRKGHFRWDELVGDVHNANAVPTLPPFSSIDTAQNHDRSHTADRPTFSQPHLPRSTTAGSTLHHAPSGPPRFDSTPDLSKQSPVPPNPPSRNSLYGKSEHGAPAAPQMHSSSPARGYETNLYPKGAKLIISPKATDYHRNSYACEEPGCGWEGKTQSEFKKHEARHKREHICEVDGCQRRKGFATINDLERHQKTVHNIVPSHGYNRVYRCFAAGCAKHEKEWPRLDNFKQHLIRMHKDQDTDSLVKKSVVYGFIPVAFWR